MRSLHQFKATERGKLYHYAWQRQKASFLAALFSRKARAVFFNSIRTQRYSFRRSQKFTMCLWIVTPTCCC